MVNLKRNSGKMNTILITLWLLIHFILMTACSGGSESTAAAPSNNDTGKGGSTARFTVVGDVLYTIAGSYLQTYDISAASLPKKILMSTDGYMGFDVETLFAYQGYLFVGGRSGMDMYDLVATPKSPVKVSEFNHARSCDPVVVQDNYAYVTLRGGTTCGGFTNQLDIIDVADITQPVLVKSFPMTRPSGLGIDGTNLFICDGAAGLKAIDVDTVSMTLTENNTIPDLMCNDVIPNNGVLVVTSNSSVDQMDYQLNVLSTITAY